MADSKHGRQFLSPVYLNEQMVLSCAAYLFQGIETESEISNTSRKQRGGKLVLSIPALSSMLGLQGDAGFESALERRSIKQYTVGSIHMQVLDELSKKNMICDIDASRVDEVFFNSTDEAKYVKVRVSLRPSDYFNLIATLKRTISPAFSAYRLLSRNSIQANHSTNKNPRDKTAKSSKDNINIDEIEETLRSLTEQLENDYLTSGQIEMVMWTDSDSPVPVGVVDLDTAGLEPSELTAKLSDGTYYVIGKITKKAKPNTYIDLLQKTTIAKLLNLISAMNNLGIFSSNRERGFSMDDVQPIQSFFQNQVMLKIPGPAIRIIAMSVCI